MEYTPEEIQDLGIAEASVDDVPILNAPALIRRLRLVNRKSSGGELLMCTPQIALPLRISLDQTMKFGTETTTAGQYFRQVIERGDMIDAVIAPAINDVVPVMMFWIHIEYVGTPSQTGSFSKKDDGLFAMWTKSGEKAERVVARVLHDEFGHTFPAERFESPGFFEIRYEGKKIRKPDMTCLGCSLTFEVKKRNRDNHFRPSHSVGRPFDSENSRDGWHAFVFPDMEPNFLPNAAISQAIADRNFVPGSNQYDSWAQVDHLQPIDPPHCWRPT
ncbi:hypothetical protein SAMN05445504_0046 [Burkholderia sp. CF099]|nr:hypothetical protein SAMN05445504_0046 [Burkholderia sp. CF099]